MAIIDLFRKKDHVSPEQTVTMINDLFSEDFDLSRSMVQRVWWRNLLYMIGEQWLEYSRSTRSFIPRFRPEQGSPPVSNEIREYVRSIKTCLLNNKMVPVISPNTNEQEDKDAAQTGQDLLTWMDALNDNELHEEKEKMIIWLALAGTAFLRTFAEVDLGRLFLGEEGEQLRTGDVTTENILPFNVFPDRLADRMRKMRYVGIQSLKPIEWVEDTFKQIIAPAENVLEMDYQRRLMRLVGQVSPWKGYGIETGATDLDADKTCIFREVEFRPCPKYPQGRYVAVAGDKMLVDAPRMPIQVTEDGQFFWTLTDFHFNYVPGRYWSDGGVNDLISSQNQINEIDKALRDNRRTLGRNRVITPGELILERKTEMGESFLLMKYSGKDTGGAAPSFQQGTALPPQFLDERSIHKTQIQDSSGDPKNILRGQSPSATASGIMTETLRQTAERGQYPDIERYKRSMNLVYKKRLLVAQEVYTEERTIKIGGAGSEAQVKQFKSADLRNNTDIKLEEDSGLATTQAGRREALMSLMNAGLFGDILTAPVALRQELLKRFGLSGFTDQSNVHYDRAQRENSSIVAGIKDGIMTVTTPVSFDSMIIEDDPLFKFDDDAIHLDVHRNLILSREFNDLSPTVRAALVVHADIHNMRMEQKKMMEQQAAMQQPSTGQAASQPPSLSGRQTDLSGRQPDGAGPEGSEAAPPDPIMM